MVKISFFIGGYWLWNEGAALVDMFDEADGVEGFFCLQELLPGVLQGRDELVIYFIVIAHATLVMAIIVCAIACGEVWPLHAFHGKMFQFIEVLATYFYGAF